MSDILTEIDEEVRRERMLKFWKKHGSVLTGAVLVVLASAALFTFWQSRREMQLANSTTALVETLQAFKLAEPDKTVAALKDLEQKAPAGLDWMAQLYQAGVLAGADKKADAAEIYAQVSRNTAVPPLYRDLARLLAAQTRFDTAEPESLKADLTPLAAPAMPWRHSARELLGTLALKTNDSATARQWFSTMLEDPETPGNQRQRARQMLAEIAE